TTITTTSHESRQRENTTAREKPGIRFLDLVPKSEITFKNVIQKLQDYASRTNNQVLILENAEDYYDDYKQKYQNEVVAKVFTLFKLFTVDSWVYKEMNKSLRDDVRSLSYFGPYIKLLMETKNLIDEKTLHELKDDGYLLFFHG